MNTPQKDIIDLQRMLENQRRETERLEHRLENQQNTIKALHQEKRDLAKSLRSVSNALSTLQDTVTTALKNIANSWHYS